MNNFDNYINDYLNQFIFEQTDEVEANSEKYKLGIFIGKFKPPHIGHYNTLLGILGAQENIFSTRYPQNIPDCICDEAIVIVSEKPVLTDDRGKEVKAGDVTKLRKNGLDDDQIINELDIKMVFTADQALDLWQSYINGSPISGKATVQSGNPVNGAIKILEDIKSAGSYNDIPLSDLNIRLFVGEEEGEDNEIDVEETNKQMQRYSFILKNQKDLMGIDDGDDPVKVCVMARQTSATAVRNQILRIAVEEQDLQTLRENIPSHINLNDFWNTVRQSLV